MLVQQEKKRLMEQFSISCREHGLKITPQRAAIYKEIISSREHPSADQVFRAVRREYPNVSFDTVNRTLLTFADIGLISIAESSVGIRRFEPDLNAHHHMHCVSCGAIFDFDHADYDTIAVPDKISDSFTVIGKRVVLQVLCPACLDRKKDDLTDAAN
ncbi:MAG: transcriptional repressor [Chlorobiaceae bacterium]|nr:transcriptional repressor [Chlorobiaceae bacterium]NTW62633.1 transcriptional repressor [Chlorobiaceae bacterium]